MTIDEAITTLRVRPMDSDAWGIVYSVLTPEIVAYVSSTLFTFNMPSHDVGDIVHDSFIAVMQQWAEASAGIDTSSELLAYLKRTARNKLIDRYRHEKRATKLLAFLSLTFRIAFREDTAAYRRLFVEQVIANLPSNCKEVLSAYVSGDFSPAELAERFQLSPAGFYSRWYRCLERARDFVKKKPLDAR